MLFKGCSRVWAEIIPSEPDTDNADAGMIRYHTTNSPYFVLFINKVKRKDEKIVSDGCHECRNNGTGYRTGHAEKRGTGASRDS